MTSRITPTKLSKLSDKDLLSLRLCDLPVKIEGSAIEPYIMRLYDELKAKGVTFKPHFWISDEWFSPDESPGVAIPFYLFHPRLLKLERKLMLEVEGDGELELMRILRHEAGHAIDTAFKLHRRRVWFNTFGPFSKPYPESYRPRPGSREFVHHLDAWYAQAHPAEDFAETFAVWLTPGSKWKQRYKGWKALDKLVIVDSLMKSISSKAPKNKSRRKIDTTKSQKQTLLEHYNKKQLTYSNDLPTIYDRDLKRIFRPKSEARVLTETAPSFLRRKRAALRTLISDWTNLAPYTVDQVLGEMITRSKELKLQLKSSERLSKEQVAIMMTVRIMNFVHAGHYRFAL